MPAQQVLNEDGVNEWLPDSDWTFNIVINRGGVVTPDSFVGASATLQITNPNNENVILLGAKLATTLDDGTKVATFDILDTENALFPVGLMRGDIEITLSGGAKRKGEQLLINVIGSAHEQT